MQQEDKLFPVILQSMPIIWILKAEYDEMLYILYRKNM